MDDVWAAAVPDRRIAARIPAINDLFVYTRCSFWTCGAMLVECWLLTSGHPLCPARPEVLAKAARRSRRAQGDDVAVGGGGRIARHGGGAIRDDRRGVERRIACRHLFQEDLR